MKIYIYTKKPYRGLAYTVIPGTPVIKEYPLIDISKKGGRKELIDFITAWREQEGDEQAEIIISNTQKYTEVEVVD